MPRNWESIAEGTEGDYVVTDFQQALHQLVTQQCLYARFQHQSVAYRLISAFRNEFQEAVALQGLRLGFKDKLQFCFVTQEVTKPQLMDKKETQFLLALRHAYHLHATSGDLNELGEAHVGLVEFQEGHKALTGQDIDVRTKVLEPLLKMAQRQGLARLVDTEDGDVQPHAILILPGIAEILSEQAIGRFGAALKASMPAANDPVAEPNGEAE
jgi:hypothetical protein